MKKIFFIFILLSAIVQGYCQKPGLPVSTDSSSPQGDSLLRFMLYENNEQVLGGMIRALGQPDTNTTGLLRWNKAYVKETGKVYQVIIRDGIRKQSPTARPASFHYFSSNADKKKRTLSMVKGEQRVTGIVFIPVKDDATTNSASERSALQAFLNTCAG